MDGLEDFLSAEQPVETQVAEPAPEAPVEAPPAAEAPTEAVETPTERSTRPRRQVHREGAGSRPAQEPQFEHAATIGERRRRQEAEAERDALRQQLAQLQQPQPVQQQQGPPDRWEDPEGYDQWLVGEATKAAKAEAVQAYQYQRIETSAAQYRTQVSDYDEKIAVFGQMVQSNPALLEQLHKAPNPAEYAYNAAKTQLEISQFGGIDGLVNARVEEALKTRQPVVPTPPIPDTLADAQSARGTSAEGSPCRRSKTS
jgi:hypothetical protein